MKIHIRSIKCQNPVQSVAHVLLWLNRTGKIQRVEKWARFLLCYLVGGEQTWRTKAIGASVGTKGAEAKQRRQNQKIAFGRSNTTIEDIALTVLDFNKEGYLTPQNTSRQLTF
uniref:Uncharacterized protein n=1 Tax=Aplanochytrium stocchinoi TaxID=215587 RepID=A0A7S3PNF7_9STRA|mmetsp:Transcript_12442/g.16161  ORF Transcript_12442/g.16161 Transcript_12442/m.16161 type:complete len:113 (-) Transcript_12442:1378-1716(-)